MKVTASRIVSYRIVSQKVLRAARPDARKAVFLVTDGYSNSGDPRPVARRLRLRHAVDVFAFGIRDGNFVELCDMASEPKHEHVYILDSFEEFEALARRALHEGCDILLRIHRVVGGVAQW